MPRPGNQILQEDADALIAAVQEIMVALGCSQTQSFCGDGIVDPGEECDDGNDNEWDTCLGDCTINNCVPPCDGGGGGA